MKRALSFLDGRELDAATFNHRDREWQNYGREVWSASDARPQRTSAPRPRRGRLRSERRTRETVLFGSLGVSFDTSSRTPGSGKDPRICSSHRI